MALPKRVGAILALFGLFASCFSPAVVQGDISLPKIFSDHMVLQQKSNVKIWGTAEPKQELTVKFDKEQKSVVADATGKWLTSISTPAAGGPYELEIAAVAGEPKVVFTDVMVGEVWLCSGQSNMEWNMTQVLNPETEIEHAKNYPNLRLFSVDRNASPAALDDFSNVKPWSVCSAESVKPFSATAYFFGRELTKRLGNDVPIGLINSSWGGTRCEAWAARGSLDQIENLGPLLRQWDENDDPTSRHRPGNLFNGMISPLKNFKVGGVIWYQGEANVGRGQQYATLFPAMISNWRSHFQNSELPFYFVQLAPYRYGDKPVEALPEIWDAQLKTLKDVPNTGMIVTTDIGNPADIHPKNKQEVGRRLALVALANLYREQLTKESTIKAFSGPIYHSMSINQNKIRVSFTHVADGLDLRDSEKPLESFLICGEDKEFVPAEATIDGEVVVVSSPQVSKPVAVRFGWTDTAQPNLINSEGLPASPFRTDSFDLESKDRAF